MVVFLVESKRSQEIFLNSVSCAKNMVVLTNMPSLTISAKSSMTAKMFKMQTV